MRLILPCSFLIQSIRFVWDLEDCQLSKQSDGFRLIPNLHLVQHLDNFKLPLEINKNIQTTKISRILQQRQTQDPLKKSPIAPCLQLGTDQPTFLVFFSFLVDFHRDKGIECRGKLYTTHPVSLQPPTTYRPYILQ